MTKAGDLHVQMVTPVVVAPMFLITGQDLVVESCKAGVLGAYLALKSQRSTPILPKRAALLRDHPPQNHLGLTGRFDGARFGY